MKSLKWSETEIHILNTVYPKYGKGDLLRTLLPERTRTSVDHKIRDLELQHTGEKTEEMTIIDARNSLNEQLQINKKIISLSNKEYEAAEIERIAFMACLHIPEHSEKNLIEAVEICKSQGIKRLIIAGDFYDCISACDSAKMRNARGSLYYTLKEELAYGEAVWEMLSKSFDRIDVISGNHPDRVRKMITERVGPDMMFLFNNFIEVAVANYDNVFPYSFFDKFGNDLSWIMQIGDLRICHAEENKSGIMAASAALEQKFYNWDNHLKWSTNGALSEWHVILEFHPHQCGTYMADGGAKMLIEGGCMRRPVQYALEGKIVYDKPQSNAMTILELVNGKVNLTNVRQIPFPIHE